MKKSVLFSTIAMIVVVIVALTTATFAWFSASESATMTTTITTDAASGLSVVTNDNDALSTTSAASFSGTSLLDPTDYPIQAGIWSPVLSTAAAMEPHVSASAANTDVVLSAAAPEFVGCTINTNGKIKLKDEKASVIPNVIRVFNGYNTSKNVELNLYISVPAGQTYSAYAAQGMCLYVAEYDNAGVVDWQAYTKYGYILESTYTTYAAKSGVSYEWKDKVADAYIDASTNTMSGTAGTKPVSVLNGKGGSAIAGAYSNHGTTAGTTGWGTLNNSTQADLITSLGATNGDPYYVLSVNLGSFAAAEGKNFVVYYWLDGVYLTDQGAGATLHTQFKVEEVTA